MKSFCNMLNRKFKPGILLITVVFLSLTGDALSISVTQTGWSSGPGVIGPVMEFSTAFWCDTGCNWERNAENLYLEYEAAVFNISDQIYAAVASGDLDADGDMDVALLETSTETLYWLENTGQGNTWVMHQIDEGIYYSSDITCSDIDGDGDLDIVIGCGDFLAWYENGSSSWTQHIIKTEYCRQLFTIDMDGDNDLDLISIWNDDILEYYISWLENVDGTGLLWEEYVIHISGFYELRGIGPADINNDSNIDIVTSFLQCHEVVWFENPGTPGYGWDQHEIGPLTYPKSVTVDDLDGDGDIDVPVVHYETGFSRLQVGWYEQNSFDSWIFHVIGNCDTSQPWRSWVRTEDFDNDGDRDVAAMGQGNYPDPSVVWAENTDGNATAWLLHTVNGEYGTYSRNFCNGDFDGDGYTDIAFANDNGTNWFKLLQYPNEGYLESSILNTCTTTTWGDIDWTCTLPGTSDTDLYFQVRSSDTGDPANMGTWSEPILNPCSLTDILTPGHGFCQYKVTMLSSTNDSTPSLHDVTISWNPLGIVENPQNQTDIYWLSCLPNPTHGAPAICFGAPDGSMVTLNIYDIAGRVQIQKTIQTPAGGKGHVVLENLPAGAYIVSMTTDDTTVVNRIVILE